MSYLIEILVVLGVFAFLTAITTIVMTIVTYPKECKYICCNKILGYEKARKREPSLHYDVVL